MTYQDQVRQWVVRCHGPANLTDVRERCDRFIEEAIELAQSLGYEKTRVTALADYVYGRPAGRPGQEVGGVAVTLAALCSAAGIEMDAEAQAELARIWTKITEIRAKQAAKPTGETLVG